MKNPVLSSTEILIENPKYVRINKDKIDETAEKFAKEELPIPDWNAPVFIEGKDESTIDFFLLGNTINFAFTDFETKQKFSTEYGGKEWKGASAMFACLKKMWEKGYPILDGRYLKEMCIVTFGRFFEGIPMFRERAQIFWEVGEVLCKKYKGHFHNLVAQSNQLLFDNGKGLVEKLTHDFPSFDDSTTYKGTKIRFDKRAQLATGMLYGRFKNEGLFQIKDVDELTVFADYELPKGLRHLGILVYEKSLAEKVDGQLMIEAYSQEEMEIRASTIHASQILIDKINEQRKEKINALNLDYKLWSESILTKDPHHLTRTIAY